MTEGESVCMWEKEMKRKLSVTENKCLGGNNTESPTTAKCKNENAFSGPSSHFHTKYFICSSLPPISGSTWHQCNLNMGLPKLCFWAGDSCSPGLYCHKTVMWKLFIDDLITNTFWHPLWKQMLITWIIKFLKQYGKFQRWGQGLEWG